MKIHQVLGNNIVSSKNEENNEIVVMGRGIGFNAKKGDKIDESKVNKIFVLDNDDYYYKDLVKKMREWYKLCGWNKLQFVKHFLNCVKSQETRTTAI